TTERKAHSMLWWDYFSSAPPSWRSAFNQSSTSCPSCRPRCSYNSYARCAMRPCSEAALLADLAGWLPFSLTGLALAPETDRSGVVRLALGSIISCPFHSDRFPYVD